MPNPHRSAAFTRRGALRAGAALATAGAFAGVTPAFAAGNTRQAVNPLIRQRADPFITRHRGQYYFTASVPEYDRVIIRASPTIGGLAGAQEVTVWRRPSSGVMGGHIWAPELHRIDGRWYIYFAAGNSDDVFHIRPYVLTTASEDPRVGPWTVAGRISLPLNTFSLDATTFAHRGKRYLSWAQHDPALGPGTSLYLAEMSSPVAITGTPTKLSTPTYDWETRGHRVNEGAAALIRNGRVFLTFSASATDANYCMGLLTANESANLLDPASWHKSPQPVFATHRANSQFGPGHNSFTTAEDGADVLVYHARQYEQITGDPLYDPNRHTRVQRLHFHADGSPDFGVPVADGPVDLSRHA
ncbi:glycoside hydrolase family 43 protein [Amycolatopsis magusensis]|uniref:glycoside hydrolase family 43 protein n=1 Tax=Amycolatopsis magusensis TaxID=882444 RepID=UPI0024A9AAF0|nr:glycoside hydrolase family 43 protein [Amycolatopsis magusensis]MDI5975461.1 glycoside hydrolase family 43 protein [Amycolatopsis magusensis]